MIKEFLLNKLKNQIVGPVDNILNDNITDLSTIFGSFLIRNIRGKIQRSITFETGLDYDDRWMEQALYSILSKYNKLDNSSMLTITNESKETTEGSGVYYNLGNGTHNLKYRGWNILLNIKSESVQTNPNYRYPRMVKKYTIITYDLSPKFVKQFEKDMLENKNILLKLNPKSSIIKLFIDEHDSDGSTYWYEDQQIPKRSIDTIYLPKEQKDLLIDTIDTFFNSKRFYRKHGIPHNLKILLYGPPGTGKSSLVKAIASHWNMNIYECTGGDNGKFIPNAITSTFKKDDGYKLYSISDIDKYPTLINEPEVDIKKDKIKNEDISYKQNFGNMINALDGILSGEDKVIIMTTNHIDKFSETLLRPGRIDLKLEISYITPEVFKEYVKIFYNKNLEEDIKLKSKNITIADLQFDAVFLKTTFEEIMKKYVK